MQKRAYMIVVVILFSAAGAVWWCASVPGKNILREGGAMALEAWNGAWGTDEGDKVATRIALSDDDASAEAQNTDATTTQHGPVAKRVSPQPSSAEEDVSSFIPVGSSSIHSIDAPENVDIPTDAGASVPADGAQIIPSTSQACSVLNGIAASPSHEVVLNEIAWMGSPAASGETPTHAGEREWMELKNNSTSDISLAGWQLLDASGNIKINFGTNDSVPAGSFYLLARTSSTFFAVPVDKTYSGALPNGGDRLILFGPQCAPSDILDAGAGWPGGNSATKQTLERDVGGNGWHTSSAPGGTPRVENAAAAPTMYVLSVATDGSASSTIVSMPAGIDCGTQCTASYASGTLVTLTEAPGPNAMFNGWSGACSGLGKCSSTIGGPVAVTADFIPSGLTLASQTVQMVPGVIQDAPPPPSPPAQRSSGPDHLVIAAVQISGASSSNDLVRILNPTSDAVDVSGWKLHKRSSSGTDYSLRTFPDASIAPGGTFVWANAMNGFSGSVGAQVSSTETLAADNSVALFDANGSVVDEVAWGTGTDQYVEGTAFPTDPAQGQVLARIVADGAIVDTDDNATDFILQ